MQTEHSHEDLKKIENDHYFHLGDKWYEGQDDPIALLRILNKFLVPWMIKRIHENFGSRPVDILDVGCGGGFCTNPLALAGHRMTGVDLSEDCLEVARRHDTTNSVHYLQADAYNLPFAENSFDVLIANDFLEHVGKPKLVLSQFSKVLRPGGLFFFNTFNRHPLAYLLVVKGMHWFIKNTPANHHVYSMFIKPEELDAMLEMQSIKIAEVRGVSPVVTDSSFWRLLASREVPVDFKFHWTKSHKVCYVGYAIKKGLSS